MDGATTVVDFDRRDAPLMGEITPKGVDCGSFDPICRSN